MLRPSIALALLLVVLIAGKVATARADEADDQYAVAAGHYAAQRWALAVDEFQTLLKEHPDYGPNHKSRFFLAEALVQLGRYDEAQTRFREYLKQEPNGAYATQAGFRAGEATLLAGHPSAARDALQDFAAKHPTDKLNAYVLNYLGQIAVSAGNGAEAEHDYREAIERFPQNPLEDDYRYGLARALELEGKRPEAEKLYRKLAEGADKALAEQALLRLASSQSAGGQYADAGETFEAFETKYPASKQLTQARTEHARALYQLGKYDAAQAILAPLADDPQAATSRYLLALAEQGAGRHDAALKQLTALEPSAPADLLPKIQLARAASLVAKEQFATAAQVLDAYLKTQRPGDDAPGSPAQRATAQLAVCYARCKQLDAARQNYDHLSRLAPPSAAQTDKSKPSELWLSTTRQIAEAALAASDAKWAGELFASLSATENPPEYIVRGLSGLGWCQLDLHEPDQAAATFDRLLEKFPDGEFASEAAWARGQALERLKKFDAALASYQLVLDKYPKSPQFADAMLAAARLHDQLHQTSQSIELYARFVAAYPDSPLLAAARYGWAWALVDAGQNKEADAQFQKVHDNFRQSRFWNDATFRLAETAVTAKQFDKARQLLDELAAAKPPQVMAEHVLYLRGELAAAQQQWNQVDAAMSELVRQFPNSTLELQASYWIAEASYRLGKYDEAGQKFATVAARTEGHKDAWLAMVPLRQAQVLGQKKQWLEAQAIAVRIETDFPNFSEQYEADYLLGRAFAAQADFAGARKRYLKVIRSATGCKSETAAMAQWMIGESYFHQENYDAALREYLRVEILYPYPRWQAAAVLQAGKCEELLGRKKEATEMYARLIKAYPNTEFTDEGTRRLRALQNAAAGAKGNTSQR